jgi:hypothetical protein
MFLVRAFLWLGAQLAGEPHELFMGRRVIFDHVLPKLSNILILSLLSAS